MSQVYPPNIVLKNLREKFFAYRGLRLAARGLAADVEPRPFTDDEVLVDMEKNGFTRLDALRAAPRGARDWVVVLVLAARGKFASHGPDLRRLLEGVTAAPQAGRLDEVIVVAEEQFFGKKNVTDVVGEFQKRSARGADPDGVAPFFNAYPYHIFSIVVPENQSVPPHSLMSEPEVATLLEQEHRAFQDLPVIPANDPPVIWLGGREGQVVKIVRPSATAGTALYFRRIERRTFS